MYNIPADAVSHPLAPWDMPDDIETETKIICWCCDQVEDECDCDDGFDPREVEV